MVSAEGIWTIYTTARVVVAGGKDSILVKFFNSLTRCRFDAYRAV